MRMTINGSGFKEMGKSKKEARNDRPDLVGC